MNGRRVVPPGWRRRASAILRDVQHQRSLIGNKLAIVRPDQSKQATYAYNPNSWITNESLGIPMNVHNAQPTISTTYAPDKALNYNSIVRNGSTTANTINSRNQYTAFGNEGLGYDPNGNLTSRSGLTLQYDAENHQKKVTKNDGTTVENFYDAIGRKVEEKVTVGGMTKTTDYVLDGDQAIEQYVDGNISARYVKGRGIDETVRADRSSNADGILDQTMYPIQDELGNVERLTDANGATLERYEYEGYGKFSISGSNDSQLSSSAYGWNWLFQGREYQPSVGAYDFRARHLWPDLCRFGQEDPIAGTGSTSRYEALGSAWGTYSDPSGGIVVLVHGIDSSGEWAGEMRTALQSAWAANGQLSQDVFVHVARTRDDREFGKLNALNAARGHLDKDTLAAGKRLATLLNELAALLSDSKSHRHEPINVIAHSHGTAILAAAAQGGLSAHLTTTVFAGSDLNPDFNLVNTFAHTDCLIALHSSGDLTAGSILAAGAFGFNSSDSRLDQRDVPNVTHFRTILGEQHGVLAWMTSEMARDYYAGFAGASSELSAGRSLAGETWSWKVRYQQLRKEFGLWGRSGNE